MTGCIMSADTPVARFTGRRVEPILPDRAPLCFQKGGDLELWLSSRAIDRHRTNSRLLKKMLRLNHSDDTDLAAALYAHGATLTDNYWVKQEGETITWGQVRFSMDYLANIALKGRFEDFSQRQNPRILQTPSPELTNTGSYEKCWKNINSVWTMLKQSTPEERFSEIFISRLGQTIGLPMAEYYDLDGYTATPDFTRGVFNFEPMWNLCYDNENYGENYDTLKRFNKKLEAQYLDILFMDALTFNPDRHTRNYGPLRDRQTGAILSMAPNFDNNMALISRGYAKDNNPKNTTSFFIQEFHQLLQDRQIRYQYPPLPDSAMLRALIKDSARNIDIRQDYVFDFIRFNYDRLTDDTQQKATSRKLSYADQVSDIPDFLEETNTNVPYTFD